MPSAIFSKTPPSPTLRVCNIPYLLWNTKSQTHRMMLKWINWETGETGSQDEKPHVPISLCTSVKSSPLLLSIEPLIPTRSVCLHPCLLWTNKGEYTCSYYCLDLTAASLSHLVAFLTQGIFFYLPVLTSALGGKPGQVTYLGSIEVIRLDIGGFISLWFLSERNGSSDKTRGKEKSELDINILHGT